jgi:ABC-type phosphate transport system substrate-binding protein
MRANGLIFVALLLGCAAQARADGAYRVIVNASSATTVVERQLLADAFLKKITSWPGGPTIRPVDQGAEAPARRKFTEEVLGRTVEAVRNYWQQQIFSGRALPPPEVDTDDEVVQYVQRYPGAVGYVSPRADTSGVRVIRVK